MGWFSMTSEDVTSTARMIRAFPAVPRLPIVGRITYGNRIDIYIAI